MVRLFAEAADPDGRTVYLTPDDFHHLAHARRALPGEEVGVVVGLQLLQGTIAELRQRDRALVLAAVRIRPVESFAPPLEIIQVMPEERRTVDELLRLLTALGPNRITLVDAASPAGENQAARWRGIIRAEAVQSRLEFLPELSWGSSGAILQAEPGVRTIVLDPSGTGEWRTGFSAAGAVRLVIGAERGFTPATLAAWRAAGAEVRRLNGGILRARTAGFAAALLVRNLS